MFFFHQSNHFKVTKTCSKNFEKSFLMLHPFMISEVELHRLRTEKYVSKYF